MRDCYLTVVDAEFFYHFRVLKTPLNVSAQIGVQDLLEQPDWRFDKISGHVVPH